MKDKIESIIDRYNGIEKLMADQDVLSNLDKLKDLAKEYKQLEPIVMTGKKYIKAMVHVLTFLVAIIIKSLWKLIQMQK